MEQGILFPNFTEFGNCEQMQQQYIEELQREEHCDKYRYLTMSNNTSTHHRNSSNSPPLSTQEDVNSVNQGLTPSIGVNLRITGQCSQGGRKYMEDFFSVAYQQSENAKDLEYAFVGIYDGHGGAEAAIFAKEHLMLEIINQKLFWSDLDQDVLRAIREGYIATHYAMWRQQDKWPKTANGLPSTAGTTATVAFIRREKLYIGHVGDSGIVLGYQNDHEDCWRAKPLTIDHKPESLEERTRIKKSGGKVVVKSGVPRVVWNRPRNANHRGPILRKTAVDEIPFLAVARSLGDLWSYNSEHDEFVVSPDPDVNVIPIDSRTFRCLIFGTDGLWNVVSPEEAVNLVREKERVNECLESQCGERPVESVQWINPSKALVEHALKTWSAKKMRADNTSVVTVILCPPEKQGRSNTSSHSKDMCNTSSLSTVKPLSCGLEYRNIGAEVPTYGAAATTTYKEMAVKYLPPEEYRNFNFYADDCNLNEVPDPDTHCLLEAQNYNDPWNVQTSHAILTSSPTPTMDCSPNKTKNNCVSQHEECTINYENYIQQETEISFSKDDYTSSYAGPYNTLLSSEPVQQTDTVANDSMSWIEPCSDSLGDITDKPHSSHSSYHSNMQITSHSNMQEIIKEQQLYQEQCMNQEDGYSLTKLETRREQQNTRLQPINKSSTANVFQNQTTPNPEDSIILYKASTHTLLAQSMTERLYYPQYVEPVPVQSKPLEFHSLLQQEYEEEKQVALERHQIYDKPAVTNLTNHQQPQSPHSSFGAYSFLTTTINDTETLIADVMMEDDQLIEELLEEEMEEEKVEAEAETSSDINECDLTIQIHEVSSSSSKEQESPAAVVDDLMTNERLNAISLSSPQIGQAREKIEKFGVLHPLNCGQRLQHLTSRSSLLARNAKPTTFVSTRRTNNHGICRLSTVSTTPMKASATGTSTRNYAKSRTRSRTNLYNNISNENLQGNPKHSSAHSVATTTKPRKNMKTAQLQTAHRMTMTPANKNLNNIQSTHIIKRQLRSNSTNAINGNPSSAPHMAYFKSTLRSRTSLTKDIKAKNNLVASTIIFPNNATSRHYQRNMELRAPPNPLLRNQPQTNQPTSFKAMKNAISDKCKSPTIPATAHNDKLNRTKSNKRPLEKHPVYNINLRSRPRPPFSLHNLGTNAESVNRATSSATQSHNSLASAAANIRRKSSLNERPILHSMHTRSTSKLQPFHSASSPVPIILSGFSKSTRSQNVGSSLAAPPPSPKLMNTIAAVAAATRARSLLSAKQAASASSPQSMVTAIFGKRSSLRSNAHISRTQLSGAAAPTSKTNCSNKLLTQPLQTPRGRIIKRLKR